jgi:hypothetical protein
MQRHFTIKILPLTVLIVFLNCLSANAQYYKPGGVKGPVGEPFEVTGEFDASKLKSNDSNYNSGYKPSDWYLEGMKWAQSISELFQPFFTPTGRNSSAPAEPVYGQLFQDPEVRPNHYFSYGIGLGIGRRGGKYDYPGGSATNAITYLQVPVIKVRYNYILSDGSALFADAGPYYALALGGRYKDNMGTEKLKFGNSSNDDFRRGDWGLKFRIGYKLKAQPILIGLTADVGLRNMVPGGDAAVKIRNQSFGLQLGYRLGFKK